MSTMKKNVIWFIASCMLLLPFASSSFAQFQKLPASLAGVIPERPTGKIAFLRAGDVWIMDADGTGQMRVAEVKNADGRLSWAPDGKRIAYTRSGKFEFREPENSGGGRKLYDIFLCYLDSVKTGNTLWYRRITSELGGRDPEWSADGSTIVFFQDINANKVSSYMPNYQICTMNPDGSKIQILRKDWDKMKEFFLEPSMSPSGMIAFEHLYGTPDPKNVENQNYKRHGIAVLPRINFTKSIDSVRMQSSRMANCFAPSWSPDGKWLAFVINSDGGRSSVGIATSDLQNKYLVFDAPTGSSVYTTSPSWSPDGKWLTFSTDDGSIYICKITGEGARRLTGPGADKYPAWSKGPVSVTPSSTTKK
jgi:Tol biopolymer transport system component